MNKEEILGAARACEDELIALRRALHRIPEYGDTLPRTRQLVCDYLDSIGLSYRVLADADGVIADICGALPGPTVALRADMDAIHGEEEGDPPWRSEIPGNMHGCGHDAHTAILLVTAKILAERRERLAGRVRLLFQSGEETGTGAKRMLSGGALDGVDALFGLHVGSLAGDGLGTGDLAILPGYVSAGKIKFTLTLCGRGTHSAFPERGLDPLPAAARILLGFAEISAREAEAGTAAVLSVGSVHAGVDHNTIPETVTLGGSIRAQEPAVRERLSEEVRALTERISAEAGVLCLADIRRGSESVWNDPHAATKAAEAVGAVLGDGVMTSLPRPLMASDDFASYAARVPSVYFLLHTNSEEKGITAPNHSPRFDLDEAVLWRGVAAYLAIVAYGIQ